VLPNVRETRFVNPADSHETRKRYIATRHSVPSLGAFFGWNLFWMKETTLSAVSSVEPSHNENGRGFLHKLGNLNHGMQQSAKIVEKSVKQRHS